MSNCPAVCTEKFREPCCPRCPLADNDHLPYGTLELAAHLLTQEAKRVK